jgi:putative oxidoreductase
MGSKTLTLVQRLFGLVLVGSTVAVLLGVPLPVITGRGKPLMDAIRTSGYIFDTIGVVYVLAGLAFLLDRWAALGAVVLFPISLNILLFHSVLHPSGIPRAAIWFGLSVVVLYANREAYRPLLQSRLGKAGEPATSEG